MSDSGGQGYENGISILFTDEQKHLKISFAKKQSKTQKFALKHKAKCNSILRYKESKKQSK